MLRRGDLAGAEEAFERSNELGIIPQPGLALLHLARGDPDAAVALISQALGNRVVFGHAFLRARLLPAQVEICVAADDLEGAVVAATELDAIADEFGTSGLRAKARFASGQLRLAEGDAAAGVGPIQESLRLWLELECPYEVARARGLLASAYLATGDTESARLELRTARLTFEKLGAVPDAHRVDQLLAGDTAPVATRVGRTFMFTDIVRSTDLVEAIGDEAWEDLIRWHDSVLRSLFTTHGGEEVSHPGDGFFVAFQEAGRAIACAIGIQRALADHRRSHGFAPQVRIGLHADEAIWSGKDYRGRAVHAAARIGAIAEGGEIVASAPTVSSDVEVTQARPVKLKGIAGPVDVVTIVWR